ncbi:MAG: Type 1 glutamine amidotransferase-like domain-containing protein [Clostridia bacterium]|nr:Type 1 glutamine amidotransferase-like domain-containing protein [Clostridia bacterium]
MEKKIIAIGGGEIKSKTTLKIDEYIVNLAKHHAGDKRATGLFIGTASHDSMPYFNSYRKTYTSVFDIKAEVALTVYGEMNYDHIKEKFLKADMIYIGGGDTKFMLDSWAQSGLKDLIFDAYERGVIIAGLSAGAICWFNKMYTDFDLMRNQQNGEYKILDGLGVLDGMCSPHFNEREVDFKQNILKYKDKFDFAYGIENDCALEFTDGKLTKVISAGGKAYKLTLSGEDLIKEELK